MKAILKARAFLEPVISTTILPRQFLNRSLETAGKYKSAATSRPLGKAEQYRLASCWSSNEVIINQLKSSLNFRDSFFITSSTLSGIISL